MGNKLRIVLLVAMPWLGGLLGDFGNVPPAYVMPFVITWGLLVACILAATYKFF